MKHDLVGVMLLVLLLTGLSILPAHTAPPPIQRPMEIVEAAAEGSAPRALHFMLVGEG